MRPLSRQKHTKRVLESEHPNGVSKSRLLPEDANHLDDTVFRCRLCKVQLPIWMTKFPQRRRRLCVTPQYKARGDMIKGIRTR